MRESEGKSAGKLSSSVGGGEAANRWNAAPWVQFVEWRCSPQDIHVMRRRSV